ncbi:MAG: hypothetical protein M0000_12050, partial [Actinomycetota bacterium]|nr:hypothetical protein [Actinomycetota bacterium]
GKWPAAFGPHRQAARYAPSLGLGLDEANTVRFGRTAGSGRAAVRSGVMGPARCRQMQIAARTWLRRSIELR